MSDYIYEPIDSDRELIAGEDIERGTPICLSPNGSALRWREGTNPVAVMKKSVKGGERFKVRDYCVTRSGIKEETAKAFVSLANAFGADNIAVGTLSEEEKQSGIYLDDEAL